MAKEMNEFKDKEFFVDIRGQRYKLSNLVKLEDNKPEVIVSIDYNPIVDIVRSPSSYGVKYKHEDNLVKIGVSPDTYDKLKRYLESKTV